MAQIGTALGQYPNDVAQAQLQKQAIGKALMQPYLNMLKANSSLQDNPRFMNTLNQIGKQYDIPIPTMGDQSDSTPAPETQGTQPAQPGTSAPAVQGSQPPLTPKAGPNAAMTMAPATQVPQVQTPPNTAMEPHTTNSAGQVVATSSGAPIPGAPQPQPVAQQATPPPQKLPRIDPSFVGATLDPATVLTLQQMPKEQRAAYLQSVGIDPKWVPKSLLTGDVVMDPVQKAKILSEIDTNITKLQLAGDLTPARLEELVNSREASGLIDKATGESILNNSTTLSEMGQGLQMKLQLLLQSGQLKQDQYNLAVKRLNAYMAGQSSLEDYRKFQEQFIGFHENYMTAQQQVEQERIGLESQRLTADTEHWDALLTQGDDRLAHQDYATLAQDTRSAEANYNSLQAQAAQIKSSNPNADLTSAVGPPGPDGKPTGESFAQTLATALQLKNKLEAQLKAANQGYRNPTPALKKLGVQTKKGASAGWTSSGYKMPDGRQFGTLPGKSGWYYQDGTPVQQ